LPSPQVIVGGERDRDDERDGSHDDVVAAKLHQMTR
jgi:hypothetical protein